MAMDERLRLDEVERKVCDIASEQLGIRRDRVSPSDRILEDLRCDSLELVELFPMHWIGEGRRLNPDAGTGVRGPDSVGMTDFERCLPAN